MALRDWRVTKDLFSLMSSGAKVIQFRPDFAFPCCVCDNNNCWADEEPCKGCDFQTNQDYIERALRKQKEADQ
jgi:hypothetical protein